MSMSRILVGIPTRERPEYLSILLSSLIFQKEQSFDVLIVDSGEYREDKYDIPPVSRFIDTLISLGHKVHTEYIQVTGRSEAAAVNFILTFAENAEYDFVYKTDDDHVLQPDTLSRLSSHVKTKFINKECPIAVSAVTPFMYKVGPSLSGPEDNPYISFPDDGIVTSLVLDEIGEPRIDIGHFTRSFGGIGLRSTHLLSAANFMMVPDSRILWEDIGNSSLHIDAVWMYKLRAILGYNFYFDMDCTSWHVVAPSGGVRVTADDFTKLSVDDFRGKSRLRHIMNVYPLKDDQ